MRLESLSAVFRFSSSAGAVHRGCSTRGCAWLECRGLVISVLLLGYLVYAMLRPEKF